MSPEPEVGFVNAEPALYATVQLAEENSAGITSRTLAVASSTRSDGPLLVTTIV